MINIKFPDQSIRQYPEGVTGLEIARSINEGLARKVLAIKLNGEVWDVTRPIFQDASIRLLTWDDDEGKATMWHSSAHLMAEAIESLYPGVKFGVGPDIENGFYYDIDFGDYQISSDDFKKIEDRMLELARQKQEFKRRDVSKAEALEYFRRKGDEYKIELINDLEDGSITLYETGQFTDLCRGPHLPNTSPIKAVKLLSIAGAYWRGDEKRKMLTRLYGITFPKAEMLAEFLKCSKKQKKEIIVKLEKSSIYFISLHAWVMVCPFGRRAELYCANDSPIF